MLTLLQSCDTHVKERAGMSESLLISLAVQYAAGRHLKLPFHHGVVHHKVTVELSLREEPGQLNLTNQGEVSRRQRDDVSLVMPLGKGG